MELKKPVDGESVWIEYPEGDRFSAEYSATHDVFIAPGKSPIAAAAVANWSRQEHEDTDISDELERAEKGGLTRS